MKWTDFVKAQITITEEINPLKCQLGYCSGEARYEALITIDGRTIRRLICSSCYVRWQREQKH